MKWLLLISSFIFISADCQTNHSSVPVNHKIFIELFTSEGCSSCPPAEKYAEELAKDSNIIVVSYHVDYWNQLGWIDSFSNHSFSEKQHHYAQLFHLSSVCTPQAIINGKAETVGSNRTIIPQLMRSAASFEKIIESQQTTINNDILSVTAKCAAKNILLEFLFVQKDATTHVLAGENNGAVLHHRDIVRQSFETTNKMTAQFSFKKNYNKDNYKVIILARDAADYSVKDLAVVYL